MAVGSLNYDERFYTTKHVVIAGVDEVGRGCLAGPVIAACCVMPRGFFIPGINDSKQLPANERVRIFEEFKKSEGCSFSLGIVSPKVIDEINILQATLLAMKKAIRSLKTKIDLVLIDGNTLPKIRIEMICEPKLDERSKLVAMASIIAKVNRDEMMKKYHEKYPQFGFDENKGYGTPFHLAALKKHKPCPIHRMKFEPVRVSQLEQMAEA